MVPTADNLIKFEISGNANIVGTDNGCQTDLEVLTSAKRKAFNGKCLAIIKAGDSSGEVVLTAVSDNLQDTIIKLKTVK